VEGAKDSTPGSLRFKDSAMADTVYIYALVDPRTDEVRYVGKTGNVVRRMTHHVWEAKRPTNHRTCWIAGLLCDGVRPRLLVLEEVPNNSWQDAERRHIAVFRQVGANLTNGTDGGDGCRGLSPEAQARIADANRGNSYALGHKHTRETRARISEALKNLSPEVKARVAASHAYKSPETRAKISATLKGSRGPVGCVRSPETRAKLSAIAKAQPKRTGWHHTPETCAKLAEGSRGNTNAMGHTASAEARKIMSAKSKAAWARRKQEHERGETA